MQAYQRLSRLLFCSLALGGCFESESDGDGDAGGGGLGAGNAGAGDAGAGDAGGGPVIGAAGTVQNTLLDELPGGLPTACEWEWSVRTLHYDPGHSTPRRMYSASCEAGGTARMFQSLALGPDAPHPTPDPTSGALLVSELDEASGTLTPTDQRLFEQCRSMHGVAVSDDCQTIGVLCRVPSGTQGFDKDVLATHPDADWMTNPYVCGDKLNDEMWLFEWTNGDIQTEPKRYIVHKSIGSWEYGNDYLRLSEDGASWGIGVKATVGGAEGSGCHEADAFLIMDRESETYTTRGWSWACGTGHTLMNRIAEDPTTGKFAALCSTDYNSEETGGLGSYVFRMEDGAPQEFHYLNLDGIQNKGAASSIVPRTGGGFLGLIVGVPGPKMPDGYPDAPPTEIGLIQWNAQGEQQGDIRWIRSDSERYLSYSTLSVLGPDRYLLGWGAMRAQDRSVEPATTGDNSFRVPWEFWLMEINEEGQSLTEPLRVEGAGWGELDEMAPLGQGRAGWAYIDNPALNPETGIGPHCNQPSIELSVYSPSTP